MSTEKSASPMTIDNEQVVPETNQDKLSALQDNIDRKGKNAYYFAHAHKADGPKWDGKQQPKLLKRESSNLEPARRGAFDYQKSNITKYSFCDEEKKVTLYCDMEGVGEKCKEGDIIFDFTDTSMQLVVRNYKEEDQILSFGKLAGKITNASFKTKADRIILTLTKAKEGTWHTINDKGNSVDEDFDEDS